MTLVIETPDTRAPERDYVLGVLLGDFLGLPWRRVPSERRDVRISLEGAHGELRLPDHLLSVPADDWLTVASMPLRPLVQWDTRDLADDITLVEPVLPVIYGDREPAVKREGESTALPVDIFGSAFFMLSRYEELVTPDRDEHDRFPAWASLAYQEGFLERPLVDEYVETLWMAIRWLWPRLQRKNHEPRTFVSCDVDNPYAAYTKSMPATLRKMGGDLLKRRGVLEAVRSLRNTLATRRGDYRHDPFDTFDWMMEVNETAGNRMAFYFLVDHSVPGKDGHYSIDEPRIRRLMRRIHNRGHEIGLHGSYGTYRETVQLQREVERLRLVMAEEAIDQEVLGCRQHYLRWDSAETSGHLAEAGLTYDTTLSFADHPGFRCGTSRQYRMFHLKRRIRLSIEQRPLLVMECSILSEAYMGVMDDEVALAEFLKYRARSHAYAGNNTMLWHNSFLTNKSRKEMYKHLVG